MYTLGEATSTAETVLGSVTSQVFDWLEWFVPYLIPIVLGLVTFYFIIRLGKGFIGVR